MDSPLNFVSTQVSRGPPEVPRSPKQSGTIPTAELILLFEDFESSKKNTANYCKVLQGLAKSSLI